MLNIKNYTSMVAATTSASAIEALLVEAGATSIMKWYENKQLVGFLFQIVLKGQQLRFRLPANEERVYQVLARKHGVPTGAKKVSLRAQASRTAWRTLHEWVQIQVSMIQIEQVEALQVFLPYNYDETTGTTFYDQVQNGSVRLLT